MSSAYSDIGLDPETTYFYRVRASNAFGDSSFSNTASDTTLEQGTVTSLADGEIPVSGTTSGTFVDTHASDDVYEAITERQSGGRPSRRHSFLEHKWTFTVPAGEVATLFVEAHHRTNNESDDFVFAYSTDDSTYTDLLTVKSDDDVGQMALLPSSVSGTVYVRVRDTDQSQGNNALDTVLVDRIYIRTASGDTMPPEAPASLTAFALSASKIDLDWADNSESDLVASYNVYRRTNLVVPYTWIGSSISLSDYSDTGLSESTTYYYVVTAVDTSQNESVFSNEASATTSSCTPATLHVDSIVLAVENLGKGSKQGRAEVTIVDDCGNLIEGAKVTGTFTGDFNVAAVIETTDGNGVAVFDTGAKKGSTAFTFCVDDVTHASLSYANVETCDSNF